MATLAGSVVLTIQSCGAQILPDWSKMAVENWGWLCAAAFCVISIAVCENEIHAIRCLRARYAAPPGVVVVLAALGRPSGPTTLGSAWC